MRESQEEIQQAQAQRSDGGRHMEVCCYPLQATFYSSENYSFVITKNGDRLQIGNSSSRVQATCLLACLNSGTKNLLEMFPGYKASRLLGQTS